MKILIYGINYAPELTGIGKYSAEMAEWLAARGHSVSVVTAPPYYPQWRVHDGYRAGRYAREERAGVSVRRPVVGAGAARWRQAPAAPGQLRPVQPSQPAARRRRAADVILVVEPALFCAPAAWLAARLCGARAWLHVQDYEVDAAFELGLLKGAWLRRAVARAERWLMRRFDRVSTISERMLALARDKGVEPARAVLLPNWIDAQAITPDLDGGAYRAQLGIPADAIVALYSGNMGGKQACRSWPTWPAAWKAKRGCGSFSAARDRNGPRCRRAAPDWRAHASWTCSPPNAWASCCAWRTSIYCRSARARPTSSCRPS